MKRVDLIKTLKMVKFVRRMVLVPTEYNNNLRIFVEVCALNSIKISKLFSFMFVLGYQMFMNYVEKVNVKSIPQMMVMTKYIREAFTDIVQYEEKEWFVDANSVLVMVDLCKKYNIDMVDLCNYITKNKFSLMDSTHLMTPNKMEAIIDVYRDRHL